MQWRLPAQLPGSCSMQKTKMAEEMVGFVGNGATSSWFSCRCCMRTNYTERLTFVGNGQWSKMSRTCCQGCWSCTMSTTQWSGGRLAMEPMEGATIPEKMYSKLWGKAVAIIKFLPPCKLWLKFHDFWKGLSFILLLVITFSSIQMLVPSLIP